MATRSDFDIIVIGGGHAGAEAAWAASNLGARTALVTMKPEAIGTMSCNPAIGGLAKGQMVREIDALGGLMGLVIDATGIQFRILNASKGPAVRGPRAQADKYRYAQQVRQLLEGRTQLSIIAGAVEGLLVEDGKCHGVVLRRAEVDGGQTMALRAEAVVLTTGTFMRGLMHTGEQQTCGGRVGEAPSVGISAELRRLGFELGRLKTGTPPRLAADTIDYQSLTEQPGDTEPRPFSDLTPQQMPGGRFPVLEQRICWCTQTNAKIHDRIRANLHRAPLFNGQIHQDSVGPRYCPSIEDKVVRFADRNAHHVFLEPESLDTNEIYCNGISTSLPADVQDAIIAGMPGCERAKIIRYGYAVEYDMVWPHQIDATCMTKRIAGLFLAGQINGTSGYEEAAGQGLLAGLNAVRYSRAEELVRLRRDEAYLGVMMDDLVTKTPREPYRMFTSRAEFRLLLRSDNAAERLTPLGNRWGLIDDQRWELFRGRQAAKLQLRSYMDTHRVQGRRMIEWARRPEVDVAAVRTHMTNDAPSGLACATQTIECVLADVQYAGYIARSLRDVKRLATQEAAVLPSGCDYSAITGLRDEAAKTLNRFQPATLGQAGRLAGVNPADLMILSVALVR